MIIAVSDSDIGDQQPRGGQEQADRDEVAALPRMHRVDAEGTVADPVGDDIHPRRDQERQRGIDAGPHHRHVPLCLQIVRQPAQIQINRVDHAALGDEQTPHRRGADEPKVADAAMRRRGEPAAAFGQDMLPFRLGDPGCLLGRRDHAAPDHDPDKADRAGDDKRPAPRADRDQPGDERRAERRAEARPGGDRGDRGAAFAQRPPEPDAAIGDRGKRRFADPEAQPGQQHRREFDRGAGRHLRYPPYRGRDRGHVVRAKAVDHAPARQHHQHVGPQER